MWTLFELYNELEVFSPGHPEFSSQPLQLLLSHGSDQLRFHVRFLVFRWLRVWNLRKLLDLLATSSSTLLKQKYTYTFPTILDFSEKQGQTSLWDHKLHFKLVEQPNPKLMTMGS